MHRVTFCVCQIGGDLQGRCTYSILTESHVIKVSQSIQRHLHSRRTSTLRQKRRNVVGYFLCSTSKHAGQPLQITNAIGLSQSFGFYETSHRHHRKNLSNPERRFYHQPQTFLEVLSGLRRIHDKSFLSFLASHGLGKASRHRQRL